MPTWRSRHRTGVDLNHSYIIIRAVLPPVGIYEVQNIIELNNMATIDR